MAHEFNIKNEEDITNYQIGRWTVIGKAYSTLRNVYWTVECICGETKELARYTLNKGLSESCGCKQREAATKHGHHSVDAGSAYISWKAMIQRTTNSNNKNYAEYAGRGIYTCERWKSFENFIEDMGERPPNKTLDRIDVDQGYSKDNCRWATATVQANNRRPTYLWKSKKDKANLSAKKINARALVGLSNWFNSNSSIAVAV